MNGKRADIRNMRAVEFGDFQTPQSLAVDVCSLLARRGIAPTSIIEPTCGLGSFLLAATDAFPEANCVGVEINPVYVSQLESRLDAQANTRCRIICRDFFDDGNRSFMSEATDPVLVVGNPPWVTNSQLGAIGGENVPKKSNFQGHAGLDALTGKSNFDISEWMLIRLLKSLSGRRGWMAMLVKTAVARKVLRHAWKQNVPFTWAEIRQIDAWEHFGVSVDACLFACAVSPDGTSSECPVYSGLNESQPIRTMAFRNGDLIAESRLHERWEHLSGTGPYQWRSGIKHDCSKVMELNKEDSYYRNGLGELVDVEEDYLYPMLKSSDVANGRNGIPTRWMLVPQRTVGENTATIQKRAPKTWAYLEQHRDFFDRRRSSIYRNRPSYSVFGVGDYTFAPWKVAISGFYKKLEFRVIGSSNDKPIVFDDTVYFVGCSSNREANLVASLLNSDIAKEFFETFVFWDAKRPITVELLRRLDLRRLAKELGQLAELEALHVRRTNSRSGQLELFAS